LAKTIVVFNKSERTMIYKIMWRGKSRYFDELQQSPRNCTRKIIDV